METTWKLNNLKCKQKILSYYLLSIVVLLQNLIQRMAEFEWPEYHFQNADTITKWAISASRTQKNNEKGFIGISAHISLRKAHKITSITALKQILCGHQSISKSCLTTTVSRTNRTEEIKFHHQRCTRFPVKSTPQKHVRRKRYRRTDQQKLR